MSVAQASFKFHLKSPADTVWLGTAFATVAKYSGLDFSNPENVLRIALDGDRDAGKTVFAEAFIEAVGFDKQFQKVHMPYFKAYKHCNESSGELRHADTNGIMSSYMMGDDFEMELFMQPRTIGGIDCVEWFHVEGRLHAVWNQNNQTNNQSAGFDFKIDIEEELYSEYMSRITNEKHTQRLLKIYCSGAYLENVGFKKFLDETSALRVP